MKTLVIHPDDRSTDFLKPIYKNILDKTVLTGEDNMYQSINDMIDSHDRVIMLGHGSTQGLFGIKFNVDYIINEQNVAALAKKADNIFIWCNADRFVVNHHLKGLYSGMFVSEMTEAAFCGIREYTESDVTYSNNRFASILGRHMEINLSKTFHNLKEEYNKVALNNNIAKYNHERLYCS